MDQCGYFLSKQSKRKIVQTFSVLEYISTGSYSVPARIIVLHFFSSNNVLEGSGNVWRLHNNIQIYVSCLVQRKKWEIEDKSTEVFLKISLNNISEDCVSVKTLNFNISATVCCRYCPLVYICNSHLRLFVCKLKLHNFMPSHKETFLAT
jgi:hypothetical protein